MCFISEYKFPLYKGYKEEIKGKSTKPNPTGNRKITKHKEKENILSLSRPRVADSLSSGRGRGWAWSWLDGSSLLVLVNSNLLHDL